MHKSLHPPLFIFLLLSAVFLAHTPSVFAMDRNPFSRPFGLMIHAGNQNLGVPRAKALEVLLRYFSYSSFPSGSREVGFPDARKDPMALPWISRACRIGLFDCRSGTFNLYQNVSRKDFLSWFFMLRNRKKSNALADVYPHLRPAARQYREIDRLNLLADGRITYSVLQEFLYRHTVSDANLSLPYSEALTLGKTEIVPAQYHDIRQIRQIEGQLHSILKLFEAKSGLSADESRYVAQVKENIHSFSALKESLIKEPHLLAERPDFPSDIAQKIRQYSLQDVLSSYTYDYSKNPSYRKHNLITGTLKMDGKVFQPDEIIDYWQIISDLNLSDFRYGWVIDGGVEKWQFGGGICGSASLVFAPSWKAGLEVIERRNHSIYYASLYPMDIIGLEATVYRPRPNLRMKNNTRSPILYHVIHDTEKQTITVEILGNKPYENIQIEGPIFFNPRWVKWLRHFTDFNGKVATEKLESKYNSIH